MKKWANPVLTACIGLIWIWVAMIGVTSNYGSVTQLGMTARVVIGLVGCVFLIWAIYLAMQRK